MNQVLMVLCMTALLSGCATAPHETTPPRKVSTVSYRWSAPEPAVSSSFVWPVRGFVISGFGDKVNGVINKGIDIRVEEGTAVRAAKSGKVVYCDPYMKGFGKTIILDHGAGYQTVYAYNSDIFVKLGDQVQQHSVIANVGSTGRAKEPSLHFEIRRNGEPQNPKVYLR